MRYLLNSLREHPELAIFLTLAVGFVIGRIKIGSFKFGNVLGTLIAGVIIGQLDIKVDATVKSVFFSLFLFATGYKVGPQFFRGLKKNAMAQVALTVVLCVTSLVTTLVAAKLLNYDTGTAAGLMAGAFTESTVIGTASDTIDRLELSDAEKTRLKNNIPVAYAVSYLVGTGFVVWFLSAAAPRLLRVDMKAESKKLAAQMSGGGGGSDQEVRLAYKEWSIRAYRLADGAAGRTVGISNRPRNPSASSWNGSAGGPRCSMPRRRKCCRRAMCWPSAHGAECCSAESCRFSRSSRTPSCSTSPWRRSTSW